MWLFESPQTATCQDSPSFMISCSLMKLLSIESVMPFNHPILCRPFFLLCSVFHSVRVFSNESAVRIRWPKHWSFSFSINPSSEYSGVISFRMDWLDLLAAFTVLADSTQDSARCRRAPGTCFVCAHSVTNEAVHTGQGGVPVISVRCAAQSHPQALGADRQTVTRS